MVVYSMKESYIIIVLLKSKIFYNSEENYSENDFAQICVELQSFSKCILTLVCFS